MKIFYESNFSFSRTSKKHFIIIYQSYVSFNYSELSSFYGIFWEFSSQLLSLFIDFTENKIKNQNNIYFPKRKAIKTRKML